MNTQWKKLIIRGLLFASKFWSKFLASGSTRKYTHTNRNRHNKEETNLHKDAQGISAKRVIGKPRNKKGNKS